MVEEVKFILGTAKVNVSGAEGSEFLLVAAKRCVMDIPHCAFVQIGKWHEGDLKVANVERACFGHGIHDDPCVDCGSCDKTDYRDAVGVEVAAVVGVEAGWTESH